MERLSVFLSFPTKTLCRRLTQISPFVFSHILTAATALLLKTQWLDLLMKSFHLYLQGNECIQWSLWLVGFQLTTLIIPWRLPMPYLTRSTSQCLNSDIYSFKKKKMVGCASCLCEWGRQELVGFRLTGRLAGVPSRDVAHTLIRETLSKQKHSWKKTCRASMQKGNCW